MGCDSCPFKGKQQVPYVGNKSSKIIFIGEAPHTEELKAGKPFIGRSGQLLNKLLTHIGLHRDEIIIANALRCPIDKETETTVAINKALKSCYDYIERLLERVSPKLVVTLGSLPYQQITKTRAKITSVRGEPVMLNGRFILLPTVHPAYVLRGTPSDFLNMPEDLMPYKAKVIFRDFQTVKEIIENDFIIPKIDISSYRKATKSDLENILKAKLVAFDFETTSAKIFDPSVRVLSVSFCAEEGTAVCSIDIDKHKDLIKKVFASKDIVKVVAHRPFDEIVAERFFGVKVQPPVYDVLTMAHIIDENNYQYNLEAVANLYTGMKNIKDLANGMRDNLEQADTQTLIQYNCVDADATLTSFNVLRKKLSDDRKLARYFKYFMTPIQDMFADIQQNGCLIDTVTLKKHKGIVEEQLKAKEANILKQLPMKVLEKYSDNLSLTRDAIISDYLFGHLKVEPKMLTAKTKKPSTSADHIAMFKDEIPLIKDFLEWKSYYKLYSSYLLTIDKYIYPDGRVYPSTLFTGTVTGRTTMLEPPIQIIPARGELAKLIKSIFIADDGWYLCARDLSQSEIRIIGWIAQDKNILDALHQGIDIHTRTASLLLGIPMDKVTKAHRTSAKCANFGLIYGMSPKGFKLYAKTEYGLDLTDEQCNHYITCFFGKPNGYYRLPVYHAYQINFTRTHGYAESPLGRRRRLPEILSDDFNLRSRAERQAINHPVSSFSTDLGLLGMYLAWQEVKTNPKFRGKVKFMWHIHDAEFFQAHQSIIHQASDLLKDCMENRTKEYIKKYFKVDVGYPIASDGKYGVNWAEMKEV